MKTELERYQSALHNVDGDVMIAGCNYFYTFFFMCDHPLSSLFVEFSFSDKSQWSIYQSGNIKAFR